MTQRGSGRWGTRAVPNRSTLETVLTPSLGAEVSIPVPWAS